MKKIILMLPILFLVTNFTYAQNFCATEPSAQFLQELDLKITNQTGCTDSIKYDLEQSIIFNLVLFYAKEGNGPDEMNDSIRNSIENDIANAFSPHNISFNVFWNNLDCDACLASLDAWPEYLETNTCIQGHVFKPGGGGEATGIGDGKFWGNYTSVPHELGHAIGLIHTHSNDSTATGYTSELVNRDPLDACGCNCLQLGDRICDTPPDPFKWGNPIPGMFSDSDCMMVNTNNVQDSCGKAFADPDQIVMNNLMSYHCDEMNLPRLTDGQNNRIRMMMDLGNGSFEYEYNPNEMPFTQGLTVNSTATKNSNEAFNGDIIINADLTIENCTIELTEGHKIIVNPGASLTIKNSTIRTYTGGICYFPMDGKTKWEGIEINPGIGNFTNVSVYTNSTLEISESGIYNPDGTEGLINLTFNNSTLNGPAIDLSNTFGLHKLVKSNFDRSVNVTDNFYLAVEGCNFNLPIDSAFSAIKAHNTNLLIGHSYPNIPTKIYNSHTSVDFVSEGIHSLAVVGVEFYDVIDGVSAYGAGGLLTVSDCTIRLRDATNVIGGGTGIYNNNMMDFKIYNNEIHGVNSNKEFGIKLTTPSENANSNLLINNKIYDCFTGIDTRTNSTDDFGDNITGVEFECNQFFNIQSDNFKTGEIGPKQGRGALDPNKRAAGNVFDGSNVGFQEFNYEGGGFDLTNYFYRDTINEEPIFYNPDTHTGFGWDRFTKERVDANPVCTYPVINNDPNQIPTVRTQVTELYDGGGTGGVIKLVKDDSDHDPTGVITDILTNSPWVSVAVVQTLLEYAQYYTASEFAQVVLANPGVIVDPYIYDVVFNSGSISNAMQLNILNAYNAGDTRIDFESGLTDIFLDGAVYSNGVIEQEIVNGTVNMGVIRSEIDKKISKTKYFQIVETYLYEDDYANALLALTAKNDIRSNDPILLAEKSAYSELVHMQSNLGNQGMNWDKLNTADYNRVVQIANTYNGFATAKARNILKIYYDLSFGDYPPKPDYPTVTFLAAGTRSTTKDARIDVYPNPTNDYINIDFIREIDVTSSEMKLYNTKGEIILRRELNANANKIDISSMAPGIYYYEITANEKRLLVDKIIIIK